MNKLTLKYIFGYALFLLIVFLLTSSRPKADTFIPTSKLQYYEGYEEDINTGNSSFHEDGYSYGSNITPPLTPGYSDHPFAISLLLDGSYKAGNTYMFTASLFANIKGSTFKFYYPDLLYMAWFARLSYKDEKVTCNFDMITENSRFDITCSYQPTTDSNRATISFVNHDWKNNGYLTYDDLGTYFKWDNINIQLYSDSSGVIIEQNQTIIDQNQTIINQNKQQLDEQKKTNDLLTDDDVGDSTNKANEFFSGFTTDTFGLTSIITAPLELIASITSSTCSPLGLKVPFLDNKTLNLPCMSSIYSQYFGSFLTIYQTITFGIIAYWVCVRIFALVKDFKNPDTDKVEVLDL